MDGYLTIGTKVDNKEFEQQLTDLQRKADKKQIDIEITTKKIGSLEEEIKRAKEERNAYFKEYEKIMAEQGRWKDLQVKGGYNLQGKELAEWQTGFLRDFDREIEDLDKKIQQSTVGNFEKVSQELEKQKRKLQDQQYEYNKIINKIDTINQKNQQQQLSAVNSQVKNIGKSLSSIVKKVAKWGLAIFGIRSAYLAIRSAMNILTQNDEQLKADIDYMKTAFAYTLEPVVREIVGLVKQLMIFIQSIVYSLTGKNIFANANKGLEKANKSASELKKTLAGFDEMNILSDTSGGGGATPSFDLSQIEDVDLSGIDRLGKKIKEMVDKIINGIVKNTSKVLKDLGFSDDYIKAWEKTWEAIKIIIDGAVDFIFGIIKMLVGFLTGNTEMVKEGFKQTIDGLKEIVFGFIDYMISLYEGAKQSIIDIITRIGEWFTKKFNEMGDKFDDWKKQFEEKWDKLANKIKDKIDKLKDRLKEKFGTIGEVVGEAIGGALKNAINRAFDRVEWLLNTPINTINSLITKIRKLPGFKDLGYISTFSLPRLAKGGIINMPNRGVPVGSAIAGEKGAEGVIPLTDSQQMALLGEAIGKYISINATVPVYVGNRMVARELKRINAEDNFAYNR